MEYNLKLIRHALNIEMIDGVPAPAPGHFGAKLRPAVQSRAALTKA